MSALSQADFDARVADLAARGEQDTTTWRPDDPGLGHPQLIAGVFVRLDVRPTKGEYGEAQVVVLRDTAGTSWAIWLFGKVLSDEFQRLRPEEGELVLVEYLGRIIRDGKPPYEKYRVEIDRQGRAVDWDRGRRANGRETLRLDPPQQPQQAPVADEPRTGICDECGFMQPRHAEQCTSAIPF